MYQCSLNARLDVGLRISRMWKEMKVLRGCLTCLVELFGSVSPEACNFKVVDSLTVGRKSTRREAVSTG